VTAEALRHYGFFRRMVRSRLGLGLSSGFRRFAAPYLGRPGPLTAGTGAAVTPP
jgi:hypothetical protein